VNEIRILLLEDNPNDAELLEYKLRNEGLVFADMRVETEPAFKQALQDFKPDIVLADYNLPTYNGYAALVYIQQVYPDIPVIMVTGAIGEERAVELLKAGARDYILKDRLTRLPAAVENALHEQDEIRSRRESEMRLREAESKFRTLFETANDGIFLQDAAGFVDCNQRGADMYGLTKKEIIGHSPAEFCPKIQPDGRLSAEVAAEKMQAALQGESQHFEWRSVRADNTTFDVDVSVSRFEFGGAVYLQSIARDITERKRVEDALIDSENRLRQLADYDALTQLPNRRLLLDRMRQAMLASQRSGRYGALMFLDLDNFKPLNDMHGHDMGDQLLIEVAHRISSCVRQVDTVARFGGDEFVVMLSELDIDKDMSIALSSIIAEKIRAILAEPYALTIQTGVNAKNTVEHRCTSSIGVVLFINHEASQEDILKWADRAMYQAKDDGRNRVCFFDPKCSQASADLHG
jgi:diguanylate cyclase (GGDEF)-like protein/PAS domain S-box-containing protein